MAAFAASAEGTAYLFRKVVLPLALVLGALAVTLALDPHDLFSPLFFLAVMLSAWIGGTASGLAAAALATFAIAYVFLPPGFTWVFNYAELPQLLVFFVSAVIIGQWSATRRRAEDGLRRARDELEVKVRERTADLESVNERLRSEIAERERAHREREQLLLLEQSARLEAVRAQQQFAELVNSVDGIVWEFDIETSRCSFVSEQAEHMLGYPVSRWLSGPNFWQGHVYPEDRESAREGYREAIATKRRQDLEYRMMAAGGRVVWVRDLVTVIVEEDRATRLRGLMTDITRRKRDEAALEEQANLLSLTHDALFVRGLDNVITYWNRGAEELYGWRSAEAVGKVTHELLKSEFPMPLDAIGSQLFETGRWEGELLHTRKDGSRLAVASRWALQRDERGMPLAVLETNNDISAQKRAQEELRRSESRYRHIFQGAGVSIWEEDFSEVREALARLKAEGIRDLRRYLADHPGFVHEALRMVKVLDVNEATLRLFGARDKSELLGSLPKVFAPETIPVFAEELVALFEDRTFLQAETVLTTLRGDRLEVLFTVAFPSEPEPLASALVSIMDITRRKQLEERLRQSEKLEVIGRFASGIAHDFNNVIGGILAYGEMLLDDATEGSPQRRYAQNILIAATRGRDLVEKILSYTRRQPGKRAPLDLCHHVAETLELVRSALPAGIALHVTTPSVPLVVVGDATQLHQVVMNLCSNSIHAMSAGGVLRVDVTAAAMNGEQMLSHGKLAAGRYAWLRVADTGSGMDEATIARIFEPFFTTKAVGQGTGLGLALVYAIVTELGGAIDVKSASGRGSEFSIYFPLAESTTQ